MFAVTASNIWRTTLTVVALVTAGAAQASEGLLIPQQMPAVRWNLDAGPIVGALALDGHLADYNWDTRPAFQAGVQAVVRHGRLGGGLKVWRAQTTQSTGIPGETTTPRVNLTAVEIVGEARVARIRALEVWGSMHTGTLHLGFDPDELTVDLGGGGGPVTVQYNAISEWDFGVGMALRTVLTRQLALALQAEGTTFALDTAHRRGNQIVEGRERFYTWSLRLQASWMVNLD